MHERISHLLLPVASLTLFFCSLVAWFFLRHIKHQKEWQQASNFQLKRISQRNNTTNMQPKEEEKSEIKVAAKQTDSTSKKSTSSSTCQEIRCLDTERVRFVRAQQQKQHEINAKIAKQQKQHAEKEKKRLPYKSLQHDIADQAYERRRKVISEEHEQLMLQGNLQQLQAHTQISELEETERRELLRLQNLEYEESLRRDQERLTQATNETERCRKRARTIEGCIHRLLRAGIHTVHLPIIEHDSEAKVEISDDDKIQVRLMFPSGRRVQATFSKCHSIGLIYDLTLVILNYKQRDQDEQAEETRDNESEQRKHNEWKELFDPFTIKSTFPPKTFEEFDLTLEQCGLQQSVMLMVIVESD